MAEKEQVWVQLHPRCTVKVCWVFGGHCLQEVFETLHEYNHALDLPIHTRFDNLDLISRSDVGLNNKTANWF